MCGDCTSPNANDLGKETTNVGWRAEFSAEDSNPENFEANSKKILADCSKSFIEVTTNVMLLVFIVLLF